MDNMEEMDKFLEMHNVLRLSQEERENMKRPITSTEIEIVVKNLPTNKSPGLGGFTGSRPCKFDRRLKLWSVVYI